MDPTEQPATASLQNHRASRIAGVDSFRALAALTVIYLHFPAIENVPKYWDILIQVCRGAVPFFSIVAGYFFMGSLMKKAAIAPVVSKYIVRLGVLFLFWTLFYTFVPPFLHAHGDISGWRQAEFLLHHPRSLLLTGGAFHLWFFSALLRALLIVAFCQWIGCLPLAIAFGIFQFVTGLLNTAYAPLGLHSFTVGGTCVYLFAAAGAVINARQIKLSAKSALVMAAAGLAMQLGEVYWLKWHFGAPPVHSPFTFGTLPFVIGLFLFSLASPHFGEKLLLHKIGTYSLGIYVIHPYLIAVFQKAGLTHFLVHNPTPSIVIIFIIGLGVSVILSKQKLLARLLK